MAIPRRVKREIGHPIGYTASGLGKAGTASEAIVDDAAGRLAMRVKCAPTERTYTHLLQIYAHANFSPRYIVEDRDGNIQNG